MRYTDIDTHRGDQVDVTFREREVMLGVAEAFAAGWPHALMRPKQARELATVLVAAATRAERDDGS